MVHLSIAGQLSFFLSFGDVFVLIGFVLFEHLFLVAFFILYLAFSLIYMVLFSFYFGKDR